VCPWSCIFCTCVITDKLCEAWFLRVFIYCKRNTWQISTKFFLLNQTFAVDLHPESKHADGHTDVPNTTFVMWINLVISKKTKAHTEGFHAVCGGICSHGLTRIFRHASEWGVIISNEANSCSTYCVGAFHRGHEGFELSLGKKVSFRFFLKSVFFLGSWTTAL